MVTTKMNWSGPNVTHFGRKSQFGPDQFILVYLDQIIMVKSKSIWSDQNCFGHIEGQGIREYKDKNNTTLRLGPPQKRYALQALKNNDCWLASVVHMTWVTHDYSCGV